MQTKNKQTISIVIITKNEEDKIARCLESVKWVDEIIVVDDMSSDKTVEVCESFGARVIRSKSKGNFDNQRNIGIDNANCDWIMQMDADEIVTEKLKNEIKQLFESNPDFSGIKFKRKNYFLGKPLMHGGWHHDFLRLFRKNAGRYIGASVHELINIKGKVGNINADIDHYLCQNISEFIERQNYYTSVEANRLLREHGIKSRKNIKYQLVIKPIKLFWKTYIKKQGFRDGMHGLIYCIFNSYIHFLKWAKYWELLQKKRHEPV